VPNDDYIPEKLRGWASFINRVGFPVVAFLILAYFHFVQGEHSIKVLGELKDVMTAVKDQLVAISR